MALLYTGQQWAVVLGILALGIALKTAVVLWLHRDVRSVGRDAWPWTIAAVFAFIPTAIVWRVKRPRPAAPRRAPERQPAGDPDPLRVGLVAPVARAAPDDGDVRDVMGAGERAPARPTTPMRRVTCPRCSAGFDAPVSADGPTRVTCPSCGAMGHV